jgi:hypothetical protein
VWGEQTQGGLTRDGTLGTSRRGASSAARQRARGGLPLSPCPEANPPLWRARPSHLRIDLVLVRHLLGEVRDGDGVPVVEFKLRRRLSGLEDERLAVGCGGRQERVELDSRDRLTASTDAAQCDARAWSSSTAPPLQRAERTRHARHHAADVLRQLEQVRHAAGVD